MDHMWYGGWRGRTLFAGFAICTWVGATACCVSCRTDTLDICTVNNPHAFCDLASVSILHMGEVNASLLLIRWWVVQKCQPPPFHPPELGSLLADWEDTPCPSAKHKPLSWEISPFWKMKAAYTTAKNSCMVDRPLAHRKSCDMCWAWISLAHLPWGFTWHLGTHVKR